MTLLTFESKQFDIVNEPRNDINPIFGHSLAEMLRQNFKQLGYKTFDEVETEDWGWYFDTNIDGQDYMVGTIAYVDSHPETDEPVIDDEPIGFLVQFDKYRGWKDILFGRNKLTPEAPVISITEAIIKNEVLDLKNYERED